jgi:hypothetical protein
VQTYYIEVSRDTLCRALLWLGSRVELVEITENNTPETTGVILYGHSLKQLYNNEWPEIQELHKKHPNPHPFDKFILWAD